MSTHWMSEAACATTDPELWFPELDSLWRVREAKNICEKCPVKKECLEYALVNGFKEGIWGGLSPTERNRLSKEKRKP
jgi:WhiB family redox-sensing transcriptional regulator